MGRSANMTALMRQLTSLRRGALGKDNLFAGGFQHFGNRDRIRIANQFIAAAGTL